MTIPAFCDWLSNTSLSMVIQNYSWVIPSVQSVHILAIATVMASIVMLNFRLLGVNGRTQTIPEVAHRFLPWVWCAVCVLACSGAILIIGEPARELESQVFWTKMSLLACVLILTGGFQFGAFRRESFWEKRRMLASITAVVSLGLWVAILAAGRWIAYMGHG
ncbi:MAG: DUF6644 family protein [Steroidobacteraceae bacterium]